MSLDIKKYMKSKPTRQEAFELAIYLAVIIDDEEQSQAAAILGAYLEVELSTEESDEAKGNVTKLLQRPTYKAAPATAIDTGGPLRLVRLKGDGDLPGEWGVVGEGHFLPCKDEEDAQRFLELYNSRLITKRDANFKEPGQHYEEDIYTVNWEEGNGNG